MPRAPITLGGRVLLLPGLQHACTIYSRLALQPAACTVKAVSILLATHMHVTVIQCRYSPAHPLTRLPARLPACLTTVFYFLYCLPAGMVKEARDMRLPHKVYDIDASDEGPVSMEDKDPAVLEYREVAVELQQRNQPSTTT